MSWLPKSPKARRRLTLVAAIAPVLALAVALTLWGLKDSISFFYTPSQADQAKPPPGRSVQLGGLVSPGSVVKHSDGRVDFVVADKIATDNVTFQGEHYRCEGITVEPKPTAKPRPPIWIDSMFASWSLSTTPSKQ